MTDSKTIFAEAVHRRAVEAVNWGIPAVNFDRMYQAMAGIGGAFNQIVYWSGLPDWKNQTLTPNSDVIYFKPFFSTKEVGPIVLEIPPADDGSITGTIMDGWQAPLEDVGPAGVDKGKGGKYLILPPGDDWPIPDGFIALPSHNYQGFALLRSVLQGNDEADVAKAVAYGKRIKLYPLSQAANPPPTVFVDAFGAVFDSAIQYDLRFFQSLDRIVQYEPWLPRDKAMLDVLRAIGIEKGKPFNPDVGTRTILEAAALEAQAWLSARFETVLPLYYAGGQWALPAMEDLIKSAPTFFETPDSYPIDARGVSYYWAFSSIKHLGAGQFYFLTTRDKNGQALDGAKSYRLTVPAKAPAKQYWSLTAYDRATHTFIRDLPWPSRSSQVEGLQANADGSVDIHFGPQTPFGKGSNWIPTKAGGRFEVLFRAYGPEKPLFDKSWKLPDIEPAA
jgi:hypothetical protein